MHTLAQCETLKTIEKGNIMLRFKPVTVEKLVCTCDRCGRPMEQDSSDCEWQERLIISFRAGYGSIFGDGNFVEGDFCQECIKTVLGKWLRVTDDSPFDSQHKPLNEADKIYQPYQFKEVIKIRSQMNQITGLLKGVGERDDMCRTLAERLGVAEDQVATIAFSHLLKATEPRSQS
jgi:hypothetical protein